MQKHADTNKLADIVSRRGDNETLLDILTLFTAPALQGPNRPDPLDGGESMSSWFVSMQKRLRELEEPFDFEGTLATLMVVPRLMILLKECLASQRWKEVVDILRVVALEFKNTSVTLWKVGFEVLMSDTNSNNGLLLQLVNQLKFLNDIEAKEMTLEYLKHFLHQGKIQDAIQVLQSSQTSGKQHWTRLVTERTTESEVMMKAYQGLVWYVEWLQAKHRLDYLEEQAHDDFDQILPSTSSILNQEEIMKIHADKALSAFESLNNTPGLLDVFIMKHAKLLEYYNRTEEANTVLSQYAEKNPDNPNAHRYLYWFLERTEATLEDQCRALKAYITLVPSDPLVLKLCQLQQSLGSGPSDILPYIFDLLDYPSCGDNLEAWECLHQILMKIFSKFDKDNIAVVKKSWNIRSSWWPPYHFGVESVLTHTDGSTRTKGEIQSYKAAIAIFLMGTDNDFSSKVAEFVDESLRMRIQEARTLTGENHVT